MDGILLERLIYSASIFASVLATWVLLRAWINVAKKAGVVGKDMNKHNKPLVADRGGIAVVAGLLAGILTYIAIRVVVYNKLDLKTIDLLALTNVILISAFLGLVDDLLGREIGVKRWQKPIFMLAAGIPLAAIKAGNPIVNLPFIGKVNLGLAYYLVFVPIVISGAANAYNMFAGFNGLEAGMGLMIFLGYFLHFYLTHQLWLAFISLLIISTLLVFLKYNWYPAKVFPGNIFSYAIGSLIGALAILGDSEKFAFIIFIPYFIEGFLLLRALKDLRQPVEAFGIPDEKDCLKEPKEKCYHQTHCIIKLLRKLKGCAKERDVTLVAIIYELVFVILGLALVDILKLF